MPETKPYHPKNHVRIVTAASLFDGHDAAINIMRRIIQSTGVRKTLSPKCLQSSETFVTFVPALAS